MKLLELAASRSKPGLPVQFNASTDISLVDAESPQEFSFLLEHLIEVGYMRATDNHLKPTMTAKGWEVLQSAASGSGMRGRCFIAMSFHPDLKQAYDEGIYLAIKEDCKMDPRRVDLIEHNEKICDKIIAEIRTCQFLVADVTLHRAGVYFEAGFAMGLGRPVVWTCRKDDLVNAHFDTRQYSHIVWENPTELRTKLRDRIIATIPK
jgi:nucleoside 2-deoxyribosyltransferase